jgi:signal transduction histidine kinase
LSGMRERVEMAGGIFRIDSAPGRGLRFEAHLPVRGEN